MIALEQNGSPNEEEQVTERAKTPFGEIARWLARVFLVSENAVSFYLNMAIVSFIALLIGSEIFMRFAFDYSYLGVVDLVTLCVLVILYASLSGVQRDNAHLRMDLLDKKLEGTRAGLIIHFISRLLTLGAALIIFYATLKTTLEIYQQQHVTLILHAYTWPAAMFMPIGWFLLCIRVGIQIKQELASALRH